MVTTFYTVMLNLVMLRDNGNYIYTVMLHILKRLLIA